MINLPKSNLTVTEGCKYRLPCGWCDRKNELCQLFRQDITVGSPLNITNPVINVLDTYLSTSDAFIPVPCRTCTNHPSNGGSGICNCVLPDLYNSSVTYDGHTPISTVTATNSTEINQNDHKTDAISGVSSGSIHTV